MTATLEHITDLDAAEPPPQKEASGSRQSPRAAWMAGAGLLSLGAGAIHATAVGAHAEHRPAVLAFTLCATLQLGWGGLALVRSDRRVAAVGMLISGSAVIGWVLAKTIGIGFIEGLNVGEAVQLADTLAASLAAASLVSVVVGTRARTTTRSAVPRIPLALLAAPVIVVSLLGMVAAGTHVHSHGGGEDLAAGGAVHAHGDAPATPVAGSGESAAPAADGHDHDHADATDTTAITLGVDDPNATATTAPPTGAAIVSHDHHATPPPATIDDQGNPAPTDTQATTPPQDHIPVVVPPVDYDPNANPTKRVDLSGVPGVTPQQQAEAEALVIATLDKLPQWADASYAEAHGFKSIGDGFTGIEHLVNGEFMNDDTMLDPDKPESLVYDTSTGGRVLVAAMYMTKPGVPLADVPKVGGALMQWHIHDNLCYDQDGHVAGVTNSDGSCPAGLVKPPNTPMIHVWIIAHKCGPFAALEGIGAGSILPGETRLCDTLHGH